MHRAGRASSHSRDCVPGQGKLNAHGQWEALAPPATCHDAAVLTLYLDLPDTPLRPSPLDQSLANRLHQQEVPLKLVESALLLATLRRLSRPSDLPPLPKIRSLAYFMPVIEELRQLPLPDGYLDYLRLKLRKLSQA